MALLVFIYYFGGARSAKLRIRAGQECSEVAFGCPEVASECSEVGSELVRDILSSLICSFRGKKLL